MAQQGPGLARYSIVKPDGERAQISVQGRDRWALENLARAGVRGCTPIDNPAPRWSAYIWNLRAQGVEIETIHERHEGPYAGTHGRYVLRCAVTRLAEGGDA